MQEVDDAALDQLGLGDRRSDSQDRLVGEEDRALRHGADLAGETQLRETAQKAWTEAGAFAQPLQFGLAELQRLERTQHLLEARRDEKVAARRELAHEELEAGEPVHAAVQIGLQHRELVQIGQQRSGHVCTL
jgi:hypothetical protein